MYDEPCPECLLTPQAAPLLEGLRRQLERARPDDVTWRAEICPRCGRLTAVTDETEGWSVGGQAPPTRPEEELPEIPGWVTPAEAAYLFRVPEHRIRRWIERDEIEHVALMPEDPDGSVLVRAPGSAGAREGVTLEGVASSQEIGDAREGVSLEGVASPHEAGAAREGIAPVSVAGGD